MYHLFIIVLLFSTPTTVNPLLCHPAFLMWVFPMLPKSRSAGLVLFFSASQMLRRDRQNYTQIHKITCLLTGNFRDHLLGGTDVNLLKPTGAFTPQNEKAARIS